MVAGVSQIVHVNAGQASLRERPRPDRREVRPARRYTSRPDEDATVRKQFGEVSEVLLQLGHQPHRQRHGRNASGTLRLIDHLPCTVPGDGPLDVDQAMGKVEVLTP